MPLKLNVGLSKKVGLPDYGSLGASCHVEVELESSLVLQDVDAFHQHVRRAYLHAKGKPHGFAVNSAVPRGRRLLSLSLWQAPRQPKGFPRWFRAGSSSTRSSQPCAKAVAAMQQPSGLHLSQCGAGRAAILRRRRMPARWLFLALGWSIRSQVDCSEKRQLRNQTNGIPRRELAQGVARSNKPRWLVATNCPCQSHPKSPGPGSPGLLAAVPRHHRVLPPPSGTFRSALGPRLNATRFAHDLPRRLHKEVRRVWMWSCALTALARGIHHLFVQRVNWPWDIAPGLALAHAAGGCFHSVADVTGHTVAIYGVTAIGRDRGM